MDEINLSNNQTDDSELNDLIDQQSEMEQEWQAKQVITPVRFNCRAKQFIIPAIHEYIEVTVSLSEKYNADQRLIFSVLYTAYYLYFCSDDFTKFRKAAFHWAIPRFVNYLNKYQFNKENRSLVLKDYENYRVTVDEVKTQSSGLATIKLAIQVALDYEEFIGQLNDIEYSYLYTLTKTKAAPKDEIAQITMTEWFGSHTWLRRDDVGIGHNLYTRLASPKALISSFRITAVTALLEIQAAKYALITFFKKNKWKYGDIPIIKELKEFENISAYNTYRYIYGVEVLNRLRKAYHKHEGDKDYLSLAMKAIVFDVTHEHSQDMVFQRIKSNLLIPKTIDKLYVISSINHQSLFSFTFLRELLSYSITPLSESQSVPVTNAESILFSWLMAYQTVQPSDIPKLSSEDFKFIRRRDGQITHIDLQYFKGRAGTIHSVKMLESKTDLGKAVLQFLQDKSDFNTNINPIKKSFKLSLGFNSPATVLIRFCQKHLKKQIDKNIATENASTVFLDAMSSLILGIRYDQKKHKNVEQYRDNINTPLSKNFFSLTSIKNSSIHSRSDSFTPTQLLNYHSHTNSVERKSYLSPENEEWINNCGRITRAVMQDLTINLFRASEKEKQTFISEFTKTSKIIETKSDDILSRMKLITGKKDGRVDELGFAHPDVYTNKSALQDSIYLIDSHETVIKLKHYQEEVRKKHRLLLDNAPEFLLFSVLPTVEWIEVLFEQKRFCKKTLSQGNALYKQYRDILPPLFTAQIGS